MKMIALWATVSCSLVEVYQRFRGAYYLHQQGDGAIRTSETPTYSNETTLRYIPEASHLQEFLFNCLGTKKP
jgi:hypothetical protein